MNIHGKEIRAIVSDFDGTIIKSGMTKPPAHFYEVIGQALEEGIPFIAASGRQYGNLQRMLSPIAHRINYICENGCLVIYQGKVIYKSIFPNRIGQALLADMEIYGADRVIVSGEDTSYLLNQNGEFMDYVANTIGNHITPLSSFTEISEPIMKISIHFKSGVPKEVTSFFHQKYDALLQVTEGGNGWFDFNMKEATKGAALTLLATHMGISTDNMIVFGDNENDVSMFKIAGISYVVSTASRHVKEYADYTCDNVEDIIKFHCISSTKRVQ